LYQNLKVYDDLVILDIEHKASPKGYYHPTNGKGAEIIKE